MRSTNNSYSANPAFDYEVDLLGFRTSIVHLTIKWIIG